MTPPVADYEYLGLFMQAVPVNSEGQVQIGPLGPEGLTICWWAYAHPRHSAHDIMRAGYFAPFAGMIRVGDMVTISARYGTAEQHTGILVRVKTVPETVVMNELAPYGFGRARSAA